MNPCIHRCSTHDAPCEAEPKKHDRFHYHEEFGERCNWDSLAIVPPKPAMCHVCKFEGDAEKIKATPCPHTAVPGAPITQRRRVIHPPTDTTGRGLEKSEIRQAARAQRAKKALIMAKLGQVGTELLDRELDIRIPNRPGLRDRTPTELKDSALKLLNQQLWNLEGVAEKEGLTELEEARLLKLLAGFNAALPKASEKEQEKSVSEMSDEELERADKR